MLYRAFEAHLIASAVNRSFDGKWLDAGCGDGRFATLLAQTLTNFGTAVGIDVDEFRLARAHSRNTHHILVKSDLTNTPFADTSFDIIVCNSVLEHTPSPMGVLKEFNRLLIPGGYLLLTVPGSDFDDLYFGTQALKAFGLNRAASKYSQKMAAHIKHFHSWNYEALKSLLQRAGFSLMNYEEYSSPYMSGAGDLLHCLRIIGIGGSRFSLLTDRVVDARRILKFVKRIAMSLELKLLNSEESNYSPNTKMGCCFVKAARL